MQVYLSGDLRVLVTEPSADLVNGHTLGEEQARMSVPEAVGVLRSPITFSVVSRTYLLNAP